MSTETKPTIRLVSWAGATKTSKRDAYLAFARWLDAEHGDDEQEKLMRLMLATHKKNDASKAYMETACWIVLMRGEEVLCVGQFHKANTLTTLVTPKSHRGKGYASMLMKWLWKTLGENGAYAICPAEKRILPLLARQGWTPADAKTNRDGTLDTMPEWVKPHYARGGIGPACAANLARQMAFLSWLEDKAGTKVPAVPA
jgi:GNAT superfamily N-acetyltransferase